MPMTVEAVRGQKLYLAVVDALRREIETGRFAEAQLLPAERVLCELLHVSRTTLRAFDGLEPMSELARALAQHFGGDPLRMTRWAADAKPRDYGAFAPQILDLAKSGDARARDVAGEAASAIAALASALTTLGAARIALVGGLGEPLRPYLPPDLARRLVRPRRDAVDGAILLAGGSLDQAEGPPCL